MKVYTLLLSMLLTSSLWASDTEYQLGNGYQIGDLPLYLGGYFSLEYAHKYGKERTLELNELALMLYGEKDRFSYMLELEGEDVYSESFGDGPHRRHQDRIHLERLYLGYSLDEHYDLKAGKFNSMIGLWNQNPINVLRDTSSNPAVTEYIFPKFVTGLELKYQGFSEDMFSFTLMAQESEDMDELINRDEVYNNFDTDRHYGLGLSFLTDVFVIQINGGYFEVKPDTGYSYVLGAFEYSAEEFRIQGEIGSQYEDDRNRALSGYLQGVYTIAEGHEGILRLESYDNDTYAVKDTFGIFGYTYRPHYAIAIKSEYQWHSYKQENKFLLSFSALF